MPRFGSVRLRLSWRSLLPGWWENHWCSGSTDLVLSRFHCGADTSHGSAQSSGSRRTRGSLIAPQSRPLRLRTDDLARHATHQTPDVGNGWAFVVGTGNGYALWLNATWANVGEGIFCG